MQRKRREKRVDGSVAQPITGAGNKVSDVRVHQRKMSVRLTDVAGAGIEALGLLCNDNRQAATFGEYLAQVAYAVNRTMQHDHDDRQARSMKSAKQLDDVAETLSPRGAYRNEMRRI